MSLRVNITGSFVATGNGTAVQVGPGSFMLSLWGAFVGTVVAEISFDGGTTWIPLSIPWIAFSAVSMTAPGCITLFCAADVGDVGAAVQVRTRCSAYTSGTINWRLSQAQRLQP